MSVYPDMSVYHHMAEPYEFPNVRNVGWIDLIQYSKGEVPDKIIEKISSLVFGDFHPGCIVEPVRAFPVCPVCGPLIEQRHGKALMESELWIPDGDRVFASPILIAHFIETHDYRPPEEYLEAVVRLSPTHSFDGNSFYREQLKANGWLSDVNVRG